MPAGLHPVMTFKLSISSSVRNPTALWRCCGKGMARPKFSERRGTTVGVNDVSFSVKGGETFIATGLSGSGKSTLVRMIKRLIEPTGPAKFSSTERT
jgi:glycine betaine/proline transport system ATP-binding protein